MVAGSTYGRELRHCRGFNGVGFVDPLLVRPASGGCARSLQGM
jgi:hypothetical protein